METNTSNQTTAPPGGAAMHWATFPTTPYAVHVVVGVVIGVVGVLAITGNAVVIYIFLRYKSLRTTGNMLVINLALSDLIMAASNCPIYAVASFFGYWPFPYPVCQFYGFMGAMFGLMSINSLTAIALDRFLVIARPHYLGGPLSMCQVNLILGAVWLNSFVWAVVPLVGASSYVLEGFGTTCTFDYLTRTESNKIFIVCMYTFAFAVPLGLIVFFYAYIFRVVHVHETTFRHTATYLKCRKIKGVRTTSMNTEIKITRTILIAITLYCLAWTPYAVIALIGQFGNVSLVTPFASALSALFAKCSTVYNPFVYFFSHPRFRRRLRITLNSVLVGRRFRHSMQQSSGYDTAMSMRNMNDCCPTTAPSGSTTSPSQHNYSKKVMLRSKRRHKSPCVDGYRVNHPALNRSCTVSGSTMSDSDGFTKPAEQPNVYSQLLVKKKSDHKSKPSYSKICSKYSLRSHLSDTLSTGIPKSFSTGSFYTAEYGDNGLPCLDYSSYEMGCIAMGKVGDPNPDKCHKRHSCASVGDSGLTDSRWFKSRLKKYGQDLPGTEALDLAKCVSSTSDT